MTFAPQAKPSKFYRKPKPETMKKNRETYAEAYKDDPQFYELWKTFDALPSAIGSKSIFWLSTQNYPNSNKVFDRVFFIGAAPHYTQDVFDYVNNILKDYE